MADNRGDDRRRPSILAIAFACDPAYGSESGAAWGMVQALAALGDVTVLVSSDHWASIDAWLATTPDSRLRFVEVALPELGSKVRRVPFLSRQMWHVTYLLWLRGAAQTAGELEARQRFDAAVHVAYGSYWLPSPVVDLAAPSVWGPVGGGTATPPRLWRFLGAKGLLSEIEKLVSVRLAALAPTTRRTWRRASVRVAETENTRGRLPRSLRASTLVANRAILASVPEVPAVPRGRDLLFPSALESRKGPRLAVQALAHTPSSVRLHFTADGPERPHVERLARRLRVLDRLEFHGRVPREQLLAMMAGSAGVVFTGLREEGGLTLAEAMLVGAPVIVLGHGGAGMLARANTDPSRVAIVSPGRPSETARALGGWMAAFSADPPRETGAYLDQDTTVATIHAAVRQAMLRRKAWEPPRAAGAPRRRSTPPGGPGPSATRGRAL